MFNIDIISIVEAEGQPLNPITLTVEQAKLLKHLQLQELQKRELERQEIIVQETIINVKERQAIVQREELKRRLSELWKIKQGIHYGLGPILKEKLDQVEQEVRLQAEELTRIQAEQEAKIQVEQEARIQTRLQAEELARIQGKGKEKEIVASSSNSRTKVKTSSDIPITMLFPEVAAKLIQQRSDINNLTADNSNNTVNDLSMSTDKGKGKEKGELTELDRKGLKDSDSYSDNKDTKSEIAKDVKDTDTTLFSKPEFKEELLEKINKFNQSREDKETAYYFSDTDTNSTNNSNDDNDNDNNNITKTVTSVFPIDNATVDVVTTDTMVENIVMINNNNNNNTTESTSITDNNTNTTTIFNQRKLEVDNNQMTSQEITIVSNNDTPTVSSSSSINKPDIDASSDNAYSLNDDHNDNANKDNDNNNNNDDDSDKEDNDNDTDNTDNDNNVIITEKMILEELQKKYANISFNAGISEEAKMLLEMQNRHLSSSSTTQVATVASNVNSETAQSSNQNLSSNPSSSEVVASSSSSNTNISSSTYTYTNLNDIYNTYGMEKSFGKETMNLIRLLSLVEKQYGVNPSRELTQAINNILPTIDPSNLDYEDLRLQLGGRYSKTISNLEILATNSRNPTLQKFIAQYNVNCYIYTQTKHGLQIYQETCDRIYGTIMQKFKAK